MSNEINNKKENALIPPDGESEIEINQKLDELIALLAESNIDSQKAKVFTERINKAIEKSKPGETDIGAFRILDTENTSRNDLLDEFSILLSTHNIDSRAARNYVRAERGANVVLMIIALVMITLGVAMVVMPAPPYFELFTIFYFTPDDGVTLMDLISLLIVLSGIYLFVKSLHKFPIKQR